MLEHGIHDIEPDTAIELFVDTRHLMAFGPDGRAIGGSAVRGAVRSETMARINLDHIRHAYGPNPKKPSDYSLKEAHHPNGTTAAPMRCSGRLAAARPRCSTSFQAC